MAPGTLDPDIDKRDRAPDQVEMRNAELLVDRRPAGGPDEGGDIVVVHAEIDIRAQLVGPPMLVVDAGREGGDRLGEHRRIVDRPARAEIRPAVGCGERAAGAAAEGAAEIGCHPDVVGDLITEAVAPGQATADAVLAPGEEVAGNRTAIAEIALREEAAVVQREPD